MKIYFTASIVGKRHYLDQYNLILNLLKEKNCTVVADHIMKSSESMIRMEDKETRINFHRQLERWIGEADAVVVEASFPSISVGYEIALSLSHGKPVLILYNAPNLAPTLLQDYKEELLVCEQYSEKTLRGIIEDFLKFVAGTGDTRFTFFIPTRMAIHLEKMAKAKREPKSVYLRNLIETDIKKYEK